MRRLISSWRPIVPVPLLFDSLPKSIRLLGTIPSGKTLLSSASSPKRPPSEAPSSLSRVRDVELLTLASSSIEVPLSLFASRQILRLAVALALAHDRSALKKVRRRYAEAMKGGADRDAFNLISSTVDRKRLSFRELPAAVAQVASFEAFMASYRERVRNQSLSAIN